MNAQAHCNRRSEMDSHMHIPLLELLRANVSSGFLLDEMKCRRPRLIASAGAIITQIEDIFETVVDCIQHGAHELVIPIKVRAKAGLHAATTATSGAIGSRADGRIKDITFPSRHPQEMRRFTALLRILELSHEALVKGVITTKRFSSFDTSTDVYYRDPELFLKQAVVNRYVGDIAYTFGMDRDALNVVAAAKGMVVGPIRIMRKDRSIIDFAGEAEGALLLSLREIEDVDISDIHWMLVIEKEATFRALASARYWRSSTAGNGVLITAKGYPDIQTRQFLRLLKARCGRTPILALVDFDPDGIGIVSTFKYGSISLAHQNESLVVPTLLWAGLRITDLKSLSLKTHGILKLTMRDRRLAVRMLEKDIFQDDVEPDWRRELQAMLKLNVKAEIQILSDTDGLEEWLNQKLLTALS